MKNIPRNPEQRESALATMECYDQAHLLISRAILFDKRTGEKPGEFLSRHMPSRVMEFTAQHFDHPILF